MADDALWIREREVVDVLDLAGAIAALDESLRLQLRGEAQDMAKTFLRWRGNTLHAIGASMEGAGLVGTKTWAYTTGGATPLLILWDALDGSLAAIIEAFALGQLRTASVSAIATHHLARPEAEVAAIIGTGKQALGQVAALVSVRSIRTIRVHSPTASHREAFALQVQEGFPEIEVTAEASIPSAVRDADVITTATRATAAFLEADDVASGAHVNAIGAITPDRREVTSALIDRCRPIVTDNPVAARHLAAELGIALTESEWENVVPLSTVVGEDAVRPADADLTLFKAMGIGLADVALGRRVLQVARAAGLGDRIPAPVHPESSFLLKSVR